MTPNSTAIPDKSERFRHYVLDPNFPCIGARSALNRDRMEFGSYNSLAAAGAVESLCRDLLVFSQKYPSPGNDPVSFVAMFDELVSSEAEFETKLWKQLQAMHAFDRRYFRWDATVSADPSSKEFSFSIAGRAFFVVGLSPVASRLARRAPFPCLVFNFHDQFQQLRENGKFTGMQKVVRSRDISLQGSINPVLAEFGDSSEARQYSGREISDDWTCPFRPEKADAC